MRESFLNDRVVLHSGDCRDVIRQLADHSIDSVVTDPPYALVSIVKRFGKPGSAPANGNDAYKRASAGFMGKQWDTGEVAFSQEFWSEILRVLKPGGHVVAFGSSRGYHRMACAIEDAGAEIRDSLCWVYSTGFPKSHSMRDIGRPELGTALKPAFEPIVLARKPLSEGTVAANVLRWGTGALNIGGCRIEGSDTTTRHNSSSSSYMTGLIGEVQPIQESYLTGSTHGRWPANVLHDGSDEVVGAFPETASGKGGGRSARDTDTSPEYWESGGGTGWRDAGRSVVAHGDSGSAARFFYSSKADSDDRLGSKHPTVKPVDLMQWLCRLITKPGGTVLDPFAGTGATAEAAYREGFNAVLIERESEYQDDIRRRMVLTMSGPDERRRESIKARVGELPFGPGSLFAEM